MTIDIDETEEAPDLDDAPESPPNDPVPTDEPRTDARLSVADQLDPESERQSGDAA